MGQWSWDSSLGTLTRSTGTTLNSLGTLTRSTGTTLNSLGTLTRSTGTTLNSLGTVERKSWNSIKKGSDDTKIVLRQVEVTNCKIKFSIKSKHIEFSKAQEKLFLANCKFRFTNFCQKRF